MKRDDLVEKVWQSITSHSLDDWAAAEDAVDAILPQVTTVEELEALPNGSKFIDADGNFWRSSWPHRSISAWPYLRTDRDEYDWGAARVLADGPLTVVWQP
jgi:hypothetical protein